MCYPVCEVMHIKEPLLPIGNRAVAGFLSRYLNGSLFSSICPTPYNRKLKNVLSASLNKTFPSFLPDQSSSIIDRVHRCLSNMALKSVVD